LKDGYLVSPSVTIYVREYHSKKIFVLGQVRKPGMFNYEERMTIVQAIAMAGGFTGLARANYAIVTRVTDGVERRIPVPVEQIVTSQDSSNFNLQPGDIVFVPEAVL
jgi:polysaccharide export outer membrane protein